MKVLVSGASGLIGRAVCQLLRQGGHEVQSLVRGQAAAGEVAWAPGEKLEARRLEGVDAIVHLAGKPVATRWTEAARREIRDSRVLGTRTLAEAATEAFRATGRPRVMVCGSATGYYGNRGDEELVETSEPGLGFLAEVCKEWEAASNVAAEAGLRVARVRTSIVLSTEGGALAKMLPAFRLGVAGKLGTGRQWWAWVTLKDAARAFVFALENERAHGALNLAAPGAVTNAEFTRTLGRVLHRPTFFAAPAFALRAVAGEMADEMLLGSQKVVPLRLLEAGFRIEDEQLEAALRGLLK